MKQLIEQDKDYFLFEVRKPSSKLSKGISIPEEIRSNIDYDFTGSLSGNVVSFGPSTKEVAIVPTVSGEGIRSDFYNPNNNRVELNTYPQKDIYVRAVFTASIESRNGSVELYQSNPTLTNITRLTTPVFFLPGTRTGVREASIPEANISPGDIFFLGVNNQDLNPPYVTASFSNTTLNITSSAATSSLQQLPIEPYLLSKFQNSNCDVLQGNATEARLNPFLQDLDYNTSQTIPVNYDVVVEGSA